MTRQPFAAAVHAGFLLGVLFLSGCDNSTDPVEPTKPLPAGARILSVTGQVKDSTGNIRVALRKRTVKPDATGRYTITDTVLAGAARAFGADTPRDTVRLIVTTPNGNDTLREVPLTSWSTILSPMSVVANPVSVNASTGSQLTGRTVEAVWWADDTIAHVLHVPNSTSADYYSTTIYSLYNDSAYAVNGHKYFIFLRAKATPTDTLPLTTSIRDIGAQNGALNYTDTFFHASYVNSRRGYSLVPADSNAIRFDLKRTVTPTDSLVLPSFTEEVAGPSNAFVAQGVTYMPAIDRYTVDVTSYTKMVISFDVDDETMIAASANGGTSDTLISIDVNYSGSRARIGSVLLTQGRAVFTTSCRAPSQLTFRNMPDWLRNSAGDKNIGLPVKNLRVVYYK